MTFTIHPDKNKEPRAQQVFVQLTEMMEKDAMEVIEERREDGEKSKNKRERLKEKIQERFEDGLRKEGVGVRAMEGLEE